MNEDNPYSATSHSSVVSTGGGTRMLAFFVVWLVLTALVVGPTVESASSGGPTRGVSYTRKSYGSPVFLECFDGAAKGGMSLPKVPGVHFYWTAAVANVVWVGGASFAVSWVASRYDPRNHNK